MTSKITVEDLKRMFDPEVSGDGDEFIGREIKPHEKWGHEGFLRLQEKDATLPDFSDFQKKKNTQKGDSFGSSAGKPSRTRDRGSSHWDHPDGRATNSRDDRQVSRNTGSSWTKSSNTNSSWKKPEVEQKVIEEPERSTPTPPPEPPALPKLVRKKKTTSSTAKPALSSDITGRKWADLTDDEESEWEEASESEQEDEQATQVVDSSKNAPATAGDNEDDDEDDWEDEEESSPSASAKTAQQSKPVVSASKPTVASSSPVSKPSLVLLPPSSPSSTPAPSKSTPLHTPQKPKRDSKNHLASPATQLTLLPPAAASESKPSSFTTPQKENRKPRDADHSSFTNNDHSNKKQQQQKYTPLTLRPPTPEESHPSPAQRRGERPSKKDNNHNSNHSQQQQAKRVEERPTLLIGLEVHAPSGLVLSPPQKQRPANNNNKANREDGVESRKDRKSGGKSPALEPQKPLILLHPSAPQQITTPAPAAASPGPKSSGKWEKKENDFKKGPKQDQKSNGNEKNWKTKLDANHALTAPPTAVPSSTSASGLSTGSVEKAVAPSNLGKAAKNINWDEFEGDSW